MTSTAPIATQAEFALISTAPEEPKDTRSWRQRQNDCAVRSGYARYNPRECKRIILAMVSADKWTGSIDLFNATRMHPDFVCSLMEQMMRQGRLERHELYFRDDDRLTRPDSKHYAGFEWGWKARNL